MELKNKEIKKLFDVVELYYDMVSLPSVMTSFMACDDAIEDEIAALKAKLTDANRYKDFYRDSANNLRSAIFERGDELRKANNQIDGLKNDLKMAEARIEAQKKTLDEERKHSEDLADANCQLASENVDLKSSLTLSENSITAWRSRAQHAEKRVMDLNKKISELEAEKTRLKEAYDIHEATIERLKLLLTQQNEIDALKKENSDLKTRNEALSATCENSLRAVSEAREEVEQYKKNNLRVTPADAIRIKSLERANKILRRENGTLWTTLEKRDIGERACYESLSETIEFQGKRIEELEAEKAKLKEAYDIHETTTKKENVDLSYGHEFEFGDEVFVPWSCDPYMYVKTGLLYNTRTKRLVYVGKDQHLKWFGEKFAIV